MAPRPKQAEPRPVPRLYLVTPRLHDAAAFTAPLKAALAAADVAAVLLRLAPADEGSMIKRAKALAPVVQDAGAALMIDGHADLVARSRADGAHVIGMTEFGEATEHLKPDWIVGVGGLATRHDAMTAAEQGADYVMFGEPDAAGARPAFAAIEERVAWWAELFEAPCVGYAGAPEEVASLAAAGADFVALGDWLWQDETKITALGAQATQHLRLPEPAA
jgi:thiamine-phosphate pyrophosphorylase